MCVVVVVVVVVVLLFVWNNTFTISHFLREDIEHIQISHEL